MITHRCDETCVCPLDGKPLLYARGPNLHACPDPECENAHGIETFIPWYVEHVMRNPTHRTEETITVPGVCLTCPEKSPAHFLREFHLGDIHRAAGL